MEKGTDTCYLSKAFNRSANIQFKVVLQQQMSTSVWPQEHLDLTLKTILV